MNTTQEKELPVTTTDDTPVTSFTRVIAVAPSTARFGGWGPKVVGIGNVLSRWN